MTEQLLRQAPFKRNEKLEDLLAKLSTALKTAARAPLDSRERPALFIVGAPRTGSTYCLQWLAASGAFSYPSNFIARFWTAPFIGGLVQEMLIEPELDYRGEFADVTPRPISDQSDAGKTAGMLSPSEFWFFWRDHFPGDGDLGLDLAKATDAQFFGFRDELARFAEVRGRPPAMKGKIVNHQIRDFAAGFPKALFLFMDRDPVDAAWSLLGARRRIYGDERRWWSFKTPDFEDLSNLDPFEQVMGQVQSIRRDVKRALADLAPNRWVRLAYHDLCTEPDGAFAQVAALFEANDAHLVGQNFMPATVPVTGKAPPPARARLEAALARFPA